MSFHFVQIRKLSGTIVGYLWRGRAVERRRNAAIYSSPSAAEAAARAYVHNYGACGLYCTIRPVPKRRRAT